MKGKRVIAAAGFCALLVALAGCNGDVSVRSFEPGDSDYRMVAGVKDATPNILLTDVRCPVTFALGSFTVQVDFTGISGGAGTIEPPTAFDLFEITGYRVTYINQSVPGGPVPAALTRSFTISAEEVPAEFDLDNFPVLSPAQKVAAPLNDPANIPPGGLQLTAVIEVFGQPSNRPGDAISDTFTMSVTVFDSCQERIDLDGDGIAAECPPADNSFPGDQLCPA